MKGPKRIIRAKEFRLFSRLRLRGLFALLPLLALAACIDSRGGSIPYQATMAAPDPLTTVAVEENYRIAPLDKLGVKVFQSENLSGDYEVDLAGNISLPLVGEVRALNLTTAELDSKLTETLGEKYFENPDVSVALKESSGRVVTVEGAVHKPGAFPVLRPLTLLQAVALAEGTREDANVRRIAIFRTINGERQAAAFDLQSIRRGEAPDPKVYSGDIVVVDGSRIKELQKQLLANLPLLGFFRPF